MQFYDDRGDLGPPPDPFRFDRGGRFRAPSGVVRWLGIAAALLVLFVLLSVLKSIYVDLLWFDSVEYASVYRRAIVWRVVLFLVGAAVSALVIGGNIWLARRLAPEAPEESFIDEVDPQAIRRVGTVLMVASTIFLALIFGSALGGAWQTILSWLNGVPFGREDPEFGRDISFYLFDLPAYQLMQGWLLALVVISTLAAGAVYALTFSLQRFVLNVTRAVRIHLSILVGVALLLVAVGTWLGIFDLVSEPGGIVDGATYTDIHARVPVRYVLIVLTAFAGATVIASAFLSTHYRVPAAALGGVAIAGLLGGGLYPSAVQSVQVRPNELEKEEPYIARNIEFTRLAFGLEAVEESAYPARLGATAAAIDENEDTTSNVRVWDPAPLLDTFNQIQSIRPFYVFNDVDVDRYSMGDGERQVMLAVRELDIGRVEANWTREQLQLTHGFGAVVSPVNESRDEGLPVLLTRDIPPVGEDVPVSLEGSRVYFGERTTHYVIVRTNVAEFDYPLGEGNSETRYEPDRGIRLSSAFRRLALAWELGDVNVLISGQLGSDSRLLMHRQLSDRVLKVAPFLELDRDPYAVILDGQVTWIQDGYTSSGRFPYAQHRGDTNYVRNSVKIVTDALTGDMTFYLMDPNEPIAATWAKIFPDLFTPFEEMPQALREHLRYPEDLFRAQSDIYLKYHITDPQVFFVGEDVWNIPLQKVGQREEPLAPYYLTMRLPGEADEEFVLVMPFTPRNKANTVGWLAGRSDPGQYGKLRAYRFPTDSLVYGPAQIEARIDQTPGISQQLSLWNQSGSQVIRGNMFMIPVADSFLFVEPIYLQAENSRLPELKRVVVANGNEIAMEPTFTEALDVVLGRRESTLPGEAGGPPLPGTPEMTPTPGPTSTPVPTPTATLTPGDLQALIDQARQASDSVQQDLDRLRQLLDQIESKSQR
ncbi:MAG: UPF0182 family protein [Dehalococcoidia bacterium]